MTIIQEFKVYLIGRSNSLIMDTYEFEKFVREYNAPVFTNYNKTLNNTLKFTIYQGKEIFCGSK